MRKIKTKGLKIKPKPPVDRGPRYAIALQAVASSQKRTKDALVSAFEINDSLADVVLRSTPVVLIRDLDLAEATQHAGRLRSSGDFRVWLEAASTKMRQMNLRFRETPTEEKLEAS